MKTTNLDLLLRMKILWSKVTIIFSKEYWILNIVINLFSFQLFLVPECLPKWIHFQTSCYYFGSSLNYFSYLTWTSAESACKDLHENSTLPSVHSEAEDQFLQSNTTSHPFWLGASRAVGASYLSPSSWTWSDGSAMNYTAWASGQPNNYWWGERCVRSLEREVAGEQSWDDHKCWSRTALALVCKLNFEWL